MNTPRTPRSPQLESAAWFKSSYSDGAGNNCIEVAQMTDTVAVRDTKTASGPAIMCSPAAFSAFVAGVQGQHDV